MLEKLKEYKEMIAIIVFFLGGFSWLQNQYPNKNDLKAELASVRCLLDNYMKLTQLQILSQEQDKKISELWRKLSEVPPDNSSKSKVSFSPAMRAELEQLRVEYTTRINQQGQTASDMVKIRDELARGICGRIEL